MKVVFGLGKNVTFVAALLSLANDQAGVAGPANHYWRENLCLAPWRHAWVTNITFAMRYWYASCRLALVIGCVLLLAEIAFWSKW